MGVGTSADVRTESRGVPLVCVAAEAMDTGRRGVQEDFRDQMANVEDGGWRIPRKHPANWCWWSHSVSIKNTGKEPYPVLKNSRSAVLLFGCVWLSSPPAASALRPPQTPRSGPRCELRPSQLLKDQVGTRAAKSPSHSARKIQN